MFSFVSLGPSTAAAIVMLNEHTWILADVNGSTSVEFSAASPSISIGVAMMEILGLRQILTSSQ